MNVLKINVRELKKEKFYLTLYKKNNTNYYVCRQEISSIISYICIGWYSRLLALHK
ncbi:hypothetical protein GCM10008932_18790 [Alkalibacterium iburiense]|uniref:Uncharacterized protein n=1 Tax=Alkalibacterium iburiense TaxID=290589 RepID=A0ABP3HC73_9LACT